MDISLAWIEGAEREVLDDYWREWFKCAPPKSLNTSLMRKILSYELQVQNGPNLDAQTRKIIRALQRRQVEGKRDQRAKTAPKLKAGSQIMREWNGATHKVEVIEGGYLWQGERYRSLSAIAEAITGAHWSGPRFFGLDKAHAKRGIAERAMSERKVAHV